MNTGNDRSWWHKGVAITSLLGVSLIVAGSIPALADPPDHAPAHGYRKNKDKDRDYDNRKGNKNNKQNKNNRGRNDNDWNRSDWNRDDRNRDDWNRSDRNRNKRTKSDWNSNRRDVTSAWASRDTDGDGVKNGRDRYPTDSRRH